MKSLCAREVRDDECVRTAMRDALVAEGSLCSSRDKLLLAVLMVKFSLENVFLQMIRFKQFL